MAKGQFAVLSYMLHECLPHSEGTHSIISGQCPYKNYSAAFQSRHSDHIFSQLPNLCYKSPYHCIEGI
jgi:hypothetical protein